MSISSALSSECDEKQLLVHQTSGTTIVSMEDFADFANHCPSTRMNKAVSCGATSLSDIGGAAMNNSTSCRGSMTSFESTSSGGIGTCSLNSHSSSSRHHSHSPSAVGFTEADVRRLKFEELVRRAMLDKSIDEYEINNCMYIAGSDRSGRPILVFIGKWFQSKNFSTEKAVLYLIKILHSVVSQGQDYVVIYFHTKTTKDNVPTYAWIKDVYYTLGYEYKKRLKSFYVVHPTLWTKMTCWWLSTFMAPAIKKKIVNIHALKELSSDPLMNGDGVGLIEDDTNLSLPMFIPEYDMTINGLRYYRP